MRNFTIFKTGSQRGVNTFMSGEGAIEHPLSTHSAPFGTSRKPAGNTAIIRCMAAMFVMLFTLGVGNMWGVDYYYTHLYMSATHTNGKVYLSTSASNPSNTNSFKNKLSSTANNKTRYTQTKSGETYYYIYAYPDANCHFVEFQVVGDVTCNGTCIIETPTTETLSNSAVVKKARVVMTCPTVANVIDQSTYATAYVQAVFAPDATGNDITYSVAVFDESGTATSIGNDATVRYTASSNTAGNYPLNYVYTYGTEAAVKNTSTTEQITLSMPHKAAPDNAYLDLPRGYNFKGWYNSSTAGTYTAVSTNDSYTTTFATANYAGARIEKKATRSVTIDSPAHGSLTVTDIEDANRSAIDNKAALIASNPMSIYKDDKLTFTATPAEGYYFYRWYYRAGNNARVDLTPTSTSTTNNVTTSVVTIPANATAIGAEFKQKKEFKVSYKNAVFTGSDYKLYTTENLYPSASAEDKTYTLYEGESMNLNFSYESPTTRGVDFKNWYYTVAGSSTKHTLPTHVETVNIIYTLSYSTLAGITGTPTFAVDVVEKSTRSLTFLSGDKGDYRVGFKDANGNGTTHTDLTTVNSTNQYFTISKDASDAAHDLYEDDRLFLEHTSAQAGNTDVNYLFHSWYWQGDDAVKHQLGDGIVTTIDTLLPEEAKKVGVTFIEAITNNITFLANEHGSYKVNGVTYDNGTKGKFDKNGITVSAGSDRRTVNNVLISSAITLSNPVCNDPEHYSFMRWYCITEDGIKKTLANLDETVSVVLPEDAVSVGMELTQAGDFAVNGLYFNSLSDAIQAAQAELKTASSSTIVVARDATVPAGNYTIPEKVTLLIPYQEGQVSPSNLRVITKADPYIGAYRTLTLADGAHLEVYGTIEVSGCQTTGGYDGQGDDVPSRTGGPYYGRMHMMGNSSITLNADAKLYAWGYVTGERDASGKYLCEVDVRRGANVYEHFQIADWKGAFPSVEITSYANEVAYHVLPICQYYIQNVEVPARYRPGSRLRGAAAINVDIMDNKTKSAGVVFAMNDVGLVGIKYPDSPEESDKAVFLLNDKDESEDTWVRKFYDPATDQQVYEINNSADVGSLVMYVTIPGIGNVLGRPQGMANRDRINVDSRAYQFPIMNNFKMHLLSGNMYVTQMTEMLPGSVIEIDKKSTLVINNNAHGNTPNDIALLFYDANDWGQFVYQNINTDTKARSWGYGSHIKYRPGGLEYNRNISTKTSQGNAQLIVHGTVDVQGDLYTTSHGASITSTIEDAGTIIFSNAAPPSVNPTYQVSAISGGNNPSFTSINRVPAWLKNDAESVYSENDGFTETANSPADKSFCFIDVDGDSKGEWVSLSNDGCFVTDGTDYYAKPQEYVALANGKTANADHTYSDKAGAGRLFIVMDDCQWWEVENVDNLYHCLNPDNDTYYYWDDSDENPANHTWKEKKFAISWKNWDGAKIRDANYPDDPTFIEPYPLSYGVTPKYLHTNPTRPDDVDYTYNFIGWTPALAPVTGDATYTAVYEKIQKKYTIIFNDASGNEINRQQLALGETPTPPTIEETSYWTPGIGVVTGNTTYTLTLGTPETYTVTFVNYDGSEYSKKSDYALGDDIVIPSDDPTRPATSENTYDFIGWSPAISAGAKVTGNATYTALYEASPKTYAIRFYKEDGTTQIGETQNLVLGATPVVPEYNKEATAQYTYATEWVDKTTINLAEKKWLKSVRTVTGAADYQAHFAATLNKYTLKLQSNNNAVCTFTGAGVYDYGTTNLAVAATISDDYTFDHWDGVDWNTTSGTIAELTGDVTLTLYVKPAGSALNNLEVSINDVTNISAATQYDNFVLTSDGTQNSGQVTNAQNIELFGNAYFDLAINAKNHKWYGVAVPWQVDATSGISVNGKTLVLGKDFDIIYYDGARRAAEGKKKCWKYVENDGDKTLQPGRLYMIGLMMDANIIRFKKKAQAALLTTSTSVTAHPQTTGDVTDANWNGVANPALFHAFVNPGVIAAQVYNPESNGYDPIEMDDAKFVVGQGAFVQAPADKSIVVTTSDSYPVSAPRRARANAFKADVRIAPAEAEYTDRLFVRVEDEKEADKYVIGKDLAKLGVSKSVAQMWINRYNTELCLNTMTMENGVAEYPLGIFAPKAGEYTITNKQSSMSNEYTLYLTFNGEAIWNLSDAAYTGTFEKGTTSAYGLRISARAPQITTGIDEAVVDAKGETRKVLIDNQVFIIRGEHIYSADGQLVK